MSEEKKAAGAASPKPEAETEPAAIPDRESVTESTVRIGGREVPYRAVAATLTLKDYDGKAKATMFHVAYTRSDVKEKDRASRPVSFIFNGGPGSASVWLHLGLFGPRRVVVGDAELPAPPPYVTVNNDFSLLDLTDLVFIDPVSTGWSRATESKDAAEFHDAKKDVESIADFIALWCSRNRRWGSPKFLMGESYGTFRAAGLAGHLTGTTNMYVNGVVLISSVLLFSTLSPDAGNDLPAILTLPSYAATAWYHRAVDRKRWKTVKALTDEVEEFALGEYASVLMRWSRARPAERAAVRDRLAAYTGLSPEYLERTHLRIEPGRFFKELLRGRGVTVGRLDSRFTGIDRDAAGENPEYDPFFPMINGLYAGAVNDYLRGELKFEEDRFYDLISARTRPWKWSDFGEGKAPQSAGALRSAMHQSRALKVLLMSGYYDLGTPFLAAEWTFDHMSLDPSLAGNVTMKRYEAGHMMYIHEPSLKQMRADFEAFIRSALPKS